VDVRELGLISESEDWSKGMSSCEKVTLGEPLPTSDLAEV